MTWYAAREARFQRDLDAMAPAWWEALGDAVHEDDRESIRGAARAVLSSVLPRLEDPGLALLRSFTGGAVPYLAWLAAMKRHGLPTPTIAAAFERVARGRFEAMPSFVRVVAGWMTFTPLVRGPYRRHAARSAQTPLGGWSWEVTEGEHFGVHYTRCPLADRMAELELGDVGPLLCQLDRYSSEAMGWGLHRTGTLAGGARRCDFTFRRGAPTEVEAPPFTRSIKD
ncbi:MAG: L-2-amino-thiazoline-4-carboxylic acid hydrolase [Alphaproteobacteria bacterium]|nr:L-2-amino-thiazoline-4-carboxylic acid hydrolase [Alphaproteobacteria bacterium]MCB9695418.1 L-2-amino-thiazoline-4-carboxylic acid hydrolase [Alphaproteobacteria bacterium]